MSKMSIETIPSGYSRHVLNGDTMGTKYSAAFFAPPGVDISAVKSRLFKAVDQVDRQMSTWKPESDLMRVNRAEVGDWVPIPSELSAVLTAALRIGRDSNGAFDIALGALVNAWGFGPEGKTPDPSRIRAHLGQINIPAYEAIELADDHMSVRRLADVQLDLSGIAKGFGVDEMVRCLRSFGIVNALCSLDGEVRSIGRNGAKGPWTVAVEKPDYDTRSPLGIINLQDAAIATSGDYRHWVNVGPSKLSHTMNRLTGGPALGQLASVSVVADTCMEADAWATVFMVLGDTAGPALARAKGFNALFILRQDDGLQQVRVGQVFE